MVDIVEALGFVEAGVEEDGVTGLGAALPNDAPIAEAGTVVGLQDAGEVGLDFRAFELGGVDVKDAAAGEGLGFGAGFDFDGVGCLAVGAVGILHGELALVFGAGLNVEDAAGEAFGDGVIKIFAAAVDVFAADAD